MKGSFMQALVTILNHSGKDHYGIFKYYDKLRSLVT